MAHPFLTCFSFLFASAIFSGMSWYPHFGQMPAVSLILFLAFRA